LEITISKPDISRFFIIVRTPNRVNRKKNWTWGRWRG